MVAEEDTGSDGSASLIDVADLPPTPRPRAFRRSMDELLQHDPPPTYDDDHPPSVFRRKFNIQPREDEGKEILPGYSSSINMQNVFCKKMELENAIHRAQDRNWYRVMVTLQGTALSFHKVSSTGFFSGPSGKKHNADYPLGTKKGLFLKSYNLRHAEVGIAADYQKKQYVIRVRAETDQFLISCHKIETFVMWLQSLFAAIDLAPPLDDREHPRDLSIPRARRRPRRLGANILRNGPLSEVELLAVPPAPDAQDSMLNSPTTSTSSLGMPSPTNPAPIIHSGLRIRPLPLQSSASQPRTFFSRREVAVNPNINAEGKWRPHHHWTHFYDMLYAKRCMAILTSRSPRKTNLVVRKSELWVVDWGTGEMRKWKGPGDDLIVREGLPGYEDAVMARTAPVPIESTDNVIEAEPETPTPLTTPETGDMEISTLALLPLMNLPSKEVDLQMHMQQFELGGA